MKPAHLILGFPVLIFLAVSVTLDFGEVSSLFPEQDHTFYMAARSLALDGDLAHTGGDSDRFFREVLRRPVPVLLAQKEILDSSGEYRSYLVYYAPDLVIIGAVPFVGFFGFRGILIFHALLMAALYWLGYRYYRTADGDEGRTAFRTLGTFTLIPLPILFLLPTHHLFLFVVCAGALFAAERALPVVSSALLAIAASSQPWAVVLSAPILMKWQLSSDRHTEGENPAISNTWRFVLTLIIGLFMVWAFERLLYPPNLTSEARWMITDSDVPPVTVWQSLPIHETTMVSRPELQQIVDFFFGRNTGFFLYAFAACSLMLSSLWLIRDRTVRSGLLFVILFLGCVSVADPSVWNFAAFVNDFWILFCVYLCFYFSHSITTKQSVVIAFFSLPFVAPLLVNPLGAISGHAYVVQEFPYAYFPVEVALAGKVGRTKQADYQFTGAGARLYFLNDGFYREEDFFWVRGESTLEFLLEWNGDSHPRLLIRNGSLDNRVRVKLGDRMDDFALAPAASAPVEIVSGRRIYKIRGNRYIHGSIRSSAGYVPKLLSRDNPDHRFLGCQVFLVTEGTQSSALDRPVERRQNRELRPHDLVASLDFKYSLVRN